MVKASFIGNEIIHFVLLTYVLWHVAETHIHARAQAHWGFESLLPLKPYKGA